MIVVDVDKVKIMLWWLNDEYRWWYVDVSCWYVDINVMVGNGW